MGFRLSDVAGLEDFAQCGLSKPHKPSSGKIMLNGVRAQLGTTSLIFEASLSVDSSLDDVIKLVDCEQDQS
jgi:hypothetical protein